MFPVSKVVIKREEPTFSPRVNDNLGTMVCFHRRYFLGDKHGMTLEKAMRFEKSSDIISLPLYMYDHGGITISTTPFSCHWDSGKIGFIYVTKEKAREWFGVKAINKKLKERIISSLQSEVNEYDHYLRGNVYAMIEYNEENKQMDYNGGYIGDIGDVIKEAESLYPNKTIVIECS